VYKDSVFHKQTNSTWAREDPAFILTLTAFMLVAAVSYGIAFSEPIVEFGFLVLEAVVVHLFVAAALFATIAWLFVSARIRADHVSPFAMGGHRVTTSHPALAPPLNCVICFLRCFSFCSIIFCV
jgi:hypothetical protein